MYAMLRNRYEVTTSSHYHIYSNFDKLLLRIAEEIQKHFYKKRVLKNSAISMGKHLCRSLFLITLLSFNKLY